MRIRETSRVLLFCYLLIISGSKPVSGQSGTLSIGNQSGAPGSINNTVSVSLNNENSVAGLMMQMDYNPLILIPVKVTAMARSESQSGLDFSIPVDGGMLITLFDFNGADIAPSSGEILRILFEVSDSAAMGQTPLRISGAAMADSSCRPFLITLEEGTFTISTDEILDAPLNLSASMISGLVLLEWEAPDTGLERSGSLPEDVILQGYRIYRSLSQNSVYTGKAIGAIAADKTDFSDSFPDQNVYYQVTAVYNAGESRPSNEALVFTSAVPGVDGAEMPAEFRLLSNSPNPFNPVTKIVYELPRMCHVELAILDILGKRVRTLAAEQKTAGRHEVTWDGLDGNGGTIASGVYLYIMKAEKYIAVRKLLLLR